jgi:hypothetical protein
MAIVLLIIFIAITNFVVFPILQGIMHRTIVLGILINVAVAVGGVHVFNALGLTDYLLYLVPALAIFSWYTNTAIRDGDYQNKKKMRITSVLSSIVFIVAFLVYSIYLHNL